MSLKIPKEECVVWVLRIVKKLKIDSKEVEGGCMRESDEKQCFSLKERGKD